MVQTTETRHAHTILKGEPFGKMVLKRVKQRWQEILKGGLQKTDHRDVEWIQMAQNKVK
jgi:hypothetical protein